MTSKSLIEVAITRPALIKKDQNARCSPTYFDITLPSNLPDAFTIHFQNYYTSSLTILQQESPESSPPRILLESKQLMRSALCEDDAQAWHAIQSRNFAQRWIPNKPLRFLLLQPCQLWLKFEIKQIKVLYAKPGEAYLLSFPNAYSASQPQLTATTAIDDSQLTNCQELITFDWRMINQQVTMQSKIRASQLAAAAMQYGGDGSLTGGSSANGSNSNANNKRNSNSKSRNSKRTNNNSMSNSSSRKALSNVASNGTLLLDQQLQSSNNSNSAASTTAYNTMGQGGGNSSSLATGSLTSSMTGFL